MNKKYGRFTLTYNNIFTNTPSFVFNFLKDEYRMTVDELINEIHFESIKDRISSIEFTNFIIYYNNGNSFKNNMKVKLLCDRAEASVRQTKTML